MSDIKKIKPLYDYVLIEPTQKETTLPSGIVLPDNDREKPLEGKIVAAGAGKKDDSGKLLSMDVKVGDVVMYKKWSGTEVKIEGKEMLLVKESELLAIIEQ
jgi:chaperonin GroES